MSPVPVTISSAETALDKFLFVSPEPWVPVLQAPAIEMCGNEARLCKANPFWYRVVLLSVTEGEDKPLKYPSIFFKSELMLLTKIDLLPYISFDVDSAVTNARKVHPGMDIVKVSCTTGEGIDDWMNWIQRKRSRKSPPHKQWSNIPVSDSTMESMVQVQKSHFEHFIP